MIKHMYMTLAALVILAIAVSAAPAKVEYDVVNYSDFGAARKNAAVENASAASDEDDDDDEDEVEQKQNDSAADDDEDEDDDDDDDVSFIRRRREAAVEPAKEPTEVDTASETTAPVEQSAEGVTTAPTTTRKPVLVLIRDALKKVTTGLPTEQVANNALQYFQLFEHFIQQTIEQVIDAADDDEEETPATTAEEDKKPAETAEVQPEKQTEDAGASDPVPAPVSVPVTADNENESKPIEPEAASNAV